MNSDAIDQVSNLLAPDSPWFRILLFCIAIWLLFYCIHRARSYHFILDRIWVFFGGTKDFTEPSLNADWQVVRDLEMFRFKYRIDVERMQQIYMLQIWLKNYEFSMLDLRAVASYFDLKKYKLRIINFKWHIRVLTAAIAVLYLATAVVLYYTLDKNDTFVVVKTQQRFKFDGSKLTFDKEILDKAQCELLRANTPPMTDAKNPAFSKYTACEIFLPDGEKFYRKSIVEKMVGGGFVGIVLVWLLFLAVFWLRRCAKLRSMHDKIIEVQKRIFIRSPERLLLSHAPSSACWSVRPHRARDTPL